MSESQTKSTNLHPAALRAGDSVIIVAPAKKIDTTYLEQASSLLKSWGLVPVIGKNAGGSWHQFSGSDTQRAEDLQWAVDHPDAKAIICARGGYGSVRIIDQINWDAFRTKPKWLVGFSDITVFHSHLNRQLACCSIHGTVPLNFEDTASESLSTLKETLFGVTPKYSWHHNPLNRTGRASGELVGGNLAMLVSIAGSESMIDTRNKILFLEEVGEYAYSLDRMMHQLKRSDKLKGLRGLVIGGLTNIKEAKDHFGFSAEEIVRDVCDEYDFPIAFDFPAGHQKQNRSLVLGANYSLLVEQDSSSLAPD